MNRRQVVQSLGLAPLAAVSAPAPVLVEARAPIVGAPTEEEQRQSTCCGMTSAMETLHRLMEDTKLTASERVNAANALASISLAIEQDPFLRMDALTYRVK